MTEKSINEEQVKLEKIFLAAKDSEKLREEEFEKHVREGEFNVDRVVKNKKKNLHSN